jgi:glycosyltransferase involved in cell wall biosynthesis
VKVALVHEYLIKQGGSENVLEALIDIFPEAPIFTSFFSAKTMPERWSQRTIYSSFLQKLPLGRQNYQKRLQYFLPLMPTAYESFDLREYDLVISSSHAFAKGVLTRPDALHVSYIHTPTRYLWDQTWEYQRSFKQLPLLKSLVPLAISQLRTWDFQAAQRPDALIANSKYIQRRIQKFYRRDAALIYPPVDTDFFRPAANNTPADFYLIAGRFVPYKRLDLAIQAFNQLGLPLWVVGEGSEVEHLKPIAKANILFKPHQSRRELADIFAQCRALIFPGEEDFGILPVEVQASGRPVIAFGKGGATETVCDGGTGILFKEQTTKSLVEAVQHFEVSVFDSKKIMVHAEQFSRQRFQTQIRKFLEESQMPTT